MNTDILKLITPVIVALCITLLGLLAICKRSNDV